MKTCLLQLKKKKKERKEEYKNLYIYYTIESCYIAWWSTYFNDRSSDNLIFTQRVSRVKNLNKNIGWKGATTRQNDDGAVYYPNTPNVVGDNFVAVGSNNRLNGQTIQVMLELDLNEQSYLFMFWMRVLLLLTLMAICGASCTPTLALNSANKTTTVPASPSMAPPFT